MDEEDVVHIFRDILFSHKNEIIPFVATWIDLEIIILNEISQTEKDKYRIDITEMWNLKKKKNELIYKTELDPQAENKLWLPKGKSREGYVRSLGLADTCGDGTPLQYSCLENPMDGGAW